MAEGAAGQRRGLGETSLAEEDTFLALPSLVDRAGLAGRDLEEDMVQVLQRVAVGHPLVHWPHEAVGVVEVSRLGNLSWMLHGRAEEGVALEAGQATMGSGDQLHKAPLNSGMAT